MDGIMAYKWIKSASGFIVSMEIIGRTLENDMDISVL